MDHESDPNVPIPDNDFNPSPELDLVQIEDEEMCLLARIEKLEQSINESASKLHMREKTEKNEGETGLENIQEQEESEIECSKHLSVNQEKLSPLHAISDHPGDEEKMMDENKAKYNEIKDEELILKEENEEEMVFINVYPNKIRDPEEISQIEKIDEQTTHNNTNSHKEKPKKAGMFNSGVPKANLFEKNVRKNENQVKNETEHDATFNQKKESNIPKMPFLKSASEMKQINEEENKKFRYSKMDEKQAEMLYQERFNQILTKFQKNNSAGPVNKKNNQKTPSLQKTPEIIDKIQKKDQNSKEKNGNFIENRDKTDSALQKTANFGGNNTFNKLNTPKKIQEGVAIPASNKRTNNSQQENLVSESGEESLKKGGRGVQRGFLLYTKAVEKHKIREQIMEEAAREKVMQEINLCTFSPNLTMKAKNLKNYENIVDKTKKSYEKFAEKLKKNELKHLEKELEDCTFSPKINKSKSNIAKSSSCDDFYRNQISWKKRVEYKNINRANSPFSSQKKLKSTSSKKTLNKDESFLSKSSKANNSMTKYISPQSTRSEVSVQKNSNYNRFSAKVPAKKPQSANKISNILEKSLNNRFSKKSQNVQKSYLANNIPNKEKLTQQINDTVTIFHSIRQHLNSNKKPKVFSKNSEGFFPSSAAKRKPSLDNSQSSLLSSNQKSKGNSLKIEKSNKKPLVFKTIPSDIFQSMDSKKNRNLWERKQEETILRLPTRKVKKAADLNTKFNEIFEKANSITNYIKKIM